MATYKEIKGTDIKVVSSDPSNPVIGEVWYNTTTQKLKGYQQVLSEAWSTGGNLNTARAGVVGSGIQTSALASGGPSTTNTEQYDGSTWTEVNNMNTARASLAGDGITTATLAFGGATPPATAVTEEWNGVSWSETNDLNSARGSLAGAGTTTASLAMGGTPTAGQTEEWNIPSNTVKTLTD